MKYVTCALFTLTLICFSCSQEQVTPNDLLSQLNASGALELKGTDTQILEGSIGALGGLEAFDSLLFIYHDVPDPYYYDVYNRNTGKYLRSFGKSGSGPGEIADYSVYSKGRAGSSFFYVLVPNEKGKVYRYDVKQLLEEKEYLPESLGKLGYDIDAFVASEDTFWCLSLFADRRLQKITNNGEVTKSYLDFPFKAEFEDFNKELLGMAFQATVVSNPERNRAAIFTYASPNIDIFNISNSVTLIKSHHLKTPEVFDESEKLSDNTFTSAISYSSQNQMGFLSVSTTENHLYALYSGRNHEKFKSQKNYANLVLVFDWDGRLEKKIKLDTDTDEITVSADDQYLYSLVEEEAKDIIKKYTLPSLQN